MYNFFFEIEFQLFNTSLFPFFFLFFFLLFQIFLTYKYILAHFQHKFFSKKLYTLFLNEHYVYFLGQELGQSSYALNLLRYVDMTII